MGGKGKNTIAEDTKESGHSGRMNTPEGKPNSVLQILTPFLGTLNYKECFLSNTCHMNIFTFMHLNHYFLTVSFRYIPRNEIVALINLKNFNTNFQMSFRNDIQI